jgi:type I restriction-modification system DNA methylase subunit
MDAPQLERHLFAATDIPRDKTDTPKFKAYVFRMLFLKRCADVFAQLNSNIAYHRRQLIKIVETWWDNCRGLMGRVELERESMHARLTDFLVRLRDAS